MTTALDKSFVLLAQDEWIDLGHKVFPLVIGVECGTAEFPLGVRIVTPNVDTLVKRPKIGGVPADKPPSIGS